MHGWDNGYGTEVSSGWYGCVPGMMGGFGMTGGAYGMIPFLPQNLTVEQSQQVSKIQSETEESSRSSFW